MALQVLLLILPTLSLVCGQLTGPVRLYQAFTGAEAEQLSEELYQNPELREFAATRNERIFVRMEDSESVVIVEEGVNVNMDCSPWLSRFPGGTIQWLFQQRDGYGQGTVDIPEVICSHSCLQRVAFRY